MQLKRRFGLRRRVTRALVTSLALGLGSVWLVPQVQAADRVEARKYFQAGMALIQAKQYTEGIGLLDKAYQILPHPSVLYNIARAYFDAGRYQESITYLERYLQTDPPDRAEAENLLSDARARLEDQFRSSAEEEKPAATRPVASAPSPQRSVASPELVAVANDLKSLTLKLNAMIEQGNALTEGSADPAPASTGQPGQQDSASGAEGVLEEAGVGETEEGEGEDVTAPAPGTRSLADPYAPVVVTSSRYAQSPLDAPNALTVIQGDELRRSGAHSIAEILRQVPGMSVMATSPSDYNIGIRGFNTTLANKVLVLVDGRSVYLDFVGATLWPLLSISPSDVERIEIIRGPGAALYGANAFSGVINIITRAPGASDDKTSVTLRGGIPDWSGGDFHVTGRQGRSAFRASLGFDRIERWSLEVDPEREDYETLAPDPQRASSINRFDARVDQRLAEKVFLSLSGGFASGQAEFQALGALRDYFVDGTSSYLRADVVLPQDVTLRAFWNRADFLAAPWTKPVGGYDLTSHPLSDIVDVEAGWSKEVEWGVTHRLNMGVGYRRKSIEWEWLDDGHVENHFNVFVQDELKFSDALAGTFSLRYDHHPVLANLTDGSPIDKAPFSPRAALVYRLNETRSVHGSLGTAFRTPTFLENYIAQPIPTSNDAVVVLNRGNLQLRPERILSFEVGYLELPSDGKYELEATAYVNGVGSLIGLGAITFNPALAALDSEGYWYAGETGFINEDARFISVGGELAGTVYPYAGLELSGNYAYNYVAKLQADDADADSSGDGGQVVIGQVVEGCDAEARDCSVSPHRFALNARYRFPQGVALGMDFQLTTRQIWGLRSYTPEGQVLIDYVPVPTYQWFGLRVDYRSPDGRFEAGVRTTNLLGAMLGIESGDPQAFETPAGTHREYPLGQAIPALVSAFTSWRF